MRNFRMIKRAGGKVPPYIVTFLSGNFSGGEFFHTDETTFSYYPLSRERETARYTRRNDDALQITLLK